MKRREFIHGSTGVAGALLLSRKPTFAEAPETKASGVKAFKKSRRFANLPVGRIAYVERGDGQAALFLHGFPLNGYQWRGALDRLSKHRRCIAPDFMGLGYSEVPDGQDLSPVPQADMLVALLDSLSVDTVDLVANDSGGAVAQLFLARHPARVRTLLLTNCDVDTNSPPPVFLPLVESARKGTLVEQLIVPQVADKAFARSSKGLGLAYTHPADLTDETIDYYLAPLVSSPLRKAQLNRYAAAFVPNPLVAIEADLKKFPGPVRMV